MFYVAFLQIFIYNETIKAQKNLQGGNAIYEQKKIECRYS